jgi:hypothetical protein
MTQFKESQQVVVIVDGSPLEVILEDRVLPDRTYGQVESGWWAWVAANDDDHPEFFVSDSGEVWSSPENEVVGYVQTADLSSNLSVTDNQD